MYTSKHFINYFKGINIQKLDRLKNRVVILKYKKKARKIMEEILGTVLLLVLITIVDSIDEFFENL